MSSPPIDAETRQQVGDLFEQFFKHGAADGLDLQLSLSLTLADVEGAKREVEVLRAVECARCGGRGAPADCPAVACGACDGKGYHEQVQGFFTVRSVCDDCVGHGETFERPCDACAGTGRVARPEKLMVTVPPGVANGHTLRIEGKGSETAQRTGDFFIALNVAPHDQLVRNGDDLITSVEISPARARVGGTVKAPLPKGSVDVQFAPGTQTGAEVRLQGYGTVKLASTVGRKGTGDEPRPSDHRGDLLVRFVLEGEQDPLGVLGLSSSATLDDIKQTYQQRAAELHPDLHPGDANAARRFDELSAAYTALTGERTQETEARASSLWWWLIVALFAFGFLYLVLR